MSDETSTPTDETMSPIGAGTAPSQGRRSAFGAPSKSLDDWIQFEPDGAVLVRSGRSSWEQEYELPSRR